MSQTQQILNHLRSGKHITPLEALNRFGCFRLGARIHELKEAGYRIRSRMVKVGEKRVAKYDMATE